MLEELSTHAQFVAPEMGVYPQDAPDDTTQRVSIRFEAGTPVAMDGDDLSLLEVFERANAIGGRERARHWAAYGGEPIRWDQVARGVRGAGDGTARQCL